MVGLSRRLKGVCRRYLKGLRKRDYGSSPGFVAKKSAPIYLGISTYKSNKEV